MSHPYSIYANTSISSIISWNFQRGSTFFTRPLKREFLYLSPFSVSIPKLFSCAAELFKQLRYWLFHLHHFSPLESKVNWSPRDCGLCLLWMLSTHRGKRSRTRKKEAKLVGWFSPQLARKVYFCDRLALLSVSTTAGLAQWVTPTQMEFCQDNNKIQPLSLRGDDNLESRIHLDLEQWRAKYTPPLSSNTQRSPPYALSLDSYIS